MEASERAIAVVWNRGSLISLSGHTDDRTEETA
jgi:hypothetical protein